MLQAEQKMGLDCYLSGDKTYNTNDTPMLHSDKKVGLGSPTRWSNVPFK